MIYDWLTDEQLKAKIEELRERAERARDREIASNALEQRHGKA